NWFSLLGAAGVCGILGLLNYFKVRFGLIQFLLGLVLWYFVFNSGVHATIAGVIFAMFVPVSRLPKLEHALHDPVNFIILPVFALAATAIIIPANFSDAITSTLSWGIIVGLVVGKPIGITFMSWLMVKLGLGEKPNGVSWSHIGGVGALAGIGFTMSIFIATLAFAEKEVQDVAKIAILVASLLAVFVGIIWLRLLKPLSNSETEDPEDSPV
ncbi:MAG TPA: Na+/H+ antiporter NhaA, partial [Parasegetibacter sp.]